MAAFFFDSSAIVKRYVVEVGTAWVTGLVDPVAGHRVHLANITGVEVIAAIARRVRGGSLTPSAARAASVRFRAEFASLYDVAQVAPGVVASAMDLAEAHGLRGSDAVQLAVAMEVDAQHRAAGVPLTLVSADAELNAAAVAEGLTVDDPGAHP